ncbi:hypothetical protein [Mesorhizobium sp. AR02]|nr:hypothetical protein [Mesorhizobium sp. AR02]
MKPSAGGGGKGMRIARHRCIGTRHCAGTQAQRYFGDAAKP